MIQDEDYTSQDDAEKQPRKEPRRIVSETPEPKDWRPFGEEW